MVVVKLQEMDMVAMHLFELLFNYVVFHLSIFELLRILYLIY